MLRKICRILLFASFTIVFTLPAHDEGFSGFDPKDSFDNLAEEKKVPLALQDALGQILIIGFQGTELTPELSKTMTEVRPGGVLLLSRNIQTPEQTQKLIADLQELSLKNTGRKLFVAIDQEGAPVLRIFWNEAKEAQSELPNFEGAFGVGEERVDELGRLGINMNLAPVLDSREWPDYLFRRSFQKDSDLSYDPAEGLVSAHHMGGVIAVPKHYPGYDDISFDPERGTIPRVSQFPDTSLFRNVFWATNPYFVMVSHVIYQDIDAANPFPFSSKGMELLKKDLGSEVVVMSDDILSKSFVSYYSFSQIGEKALRGGVDVLLAAGHPDALSIRGFHSGLYALAQKDAKIQSRIFESAEKVLRVKDELGL